MVYRWDKECGVYRVVVWCRGGIRSVVYIGL